MGVLKLDTDRSFTPGESASLTAVLEQVAPEGPVHRVIHAPKYVKP
jgi:hypothetical protein